MCQDRTDRKVIVTEVSHDFHRRLRRVAFERGISMTHIIRRGTAAELERLEAGGIRNE